MIICNGLPKSGTHALVKAVQLLGQPDTEHVHEPFGYDIGQNKHILVKRNPRNVLVSWVRFHGVQVTSGNLIGAIKRINDRSLGKLFNDYKGWLTDPSTLVVKFEDLTTDNGATIQLIANYLAVPYLTDAYTYLPGLTRTWTGNLSNWRNHWSAQVESEWNLSGADVAETDWGYANIF